ncbi:hypothetical protein K474DRAFT_1702698 [Panus rudis PR-1116 ss-1]|nr:hypothetical protein K474DRAFT_1702698 [Panus rudis PR-1116 ss-1]
MVFIAPFVGAVALFAGLANALPRPDSAIGQEVAVSAPNGVVLSDTAALASQTAAAAMSTGYAPATTTDASYQTAAAQYSSATYTAAASSMTSSSSYGSGNSNWGSYNSGGYDSCVQQCVASFGAPPATWTPSPTDSSSSSGTGTTHTVIVAPTQGVLRYVPFATYANPGDVVHFVWRANNHTVTKSSQLALCNKTDDAPFASGTHDKDFTFDQVVNDTNPVFYYCGTPGHCQKGMFGIINPPSVNNSGVNTTVGSMMSSIIDSNPELAPMASYTNTSCANNTAAASWGSTIDMGSMESWTHKYVAENVMYVRQFMAANPDVITPDGGINMNSNAPLVFPADLAAVNNAGAAPSSSSSPAASAAPSASSAAPSSSSTAAGNANSNGAKSTAVSGGLLAVAAIAASFLAL